jgi:hypothetical protein
MTLNGRSLRANVRLSGLLPSMVERIFAPWRIALGTRKYPVICCAPAGAGVGI